MLSDLDLVQFGIQCQQLLLGNGHHHGTGNQIDHTQDSETVQLPQRLRMRGELAWNANIGKARRKAMKALNTETAEVLAQVNERLAALQTTPAEINGD